MDETLTSEVSVEENTTTEEVAEDSGTNAETPAETADETTVPEPERKCRWRTGLCQTRRQIGRYNVRGTGGSSGSGT